METDSDGTAAMSGCNVSDRDGSAAKTRSDRRDISSNLPTRKLAFDEPRPGAQAQQQEELHFDVVSSVMDVSVENMDRNADDGAGKFFDEMSWNPS